MCSQVLTANGYKLTMEHAAHKPMAKVLLFGKGGQVGWELQRSLAPLGELVALDFDSTDYCGDFTNLQGLADTVLAHKPDYIVNAGAHTAVDKAESEPELVRTINALAPGALARAAQQVGAWLVHYSTDYVFDGSGQRPWVETDTTAPLNVYGQSKVEGEQLIQASGCKYLIFRTSWVYGARGGNFAKTMLKLAQERESLKVINDQFGTPTGAELLADITALALQKANHASERHDIDLSGVYHLVAAGETTWYDYAKHVVDVASRLQPSLKIIAKSIEPVSSSAFQTAAKRPSNSRMNTFKLKTTFEFEPPDWKVGVDRMLTEFLERQA